LFNSIKTTTYVFILSYSLKYFIVVKIAKVSDKVKACIKPVSWTRGDFSTTLYYYAFVKEMQRLLFKKKS